MSYMSVIACLWIISGTLLTNGLPSPSDANGPQPVSATPVSKVDETRNGSLSEVNGVHQSPSSSDSSPPKVYPDRLIEIPAPEPLSALIANDSSAPKPNSSTESTSSSISPVATVIPKSTTNTTTSEIPTTTPTTTTPTTTTPTTTTPTTTTPTTTTPTTTTPSTTTATTTTASTAPSTTTVKPTSIAPATTKAPTPTTTSAPESGRRFDGPSFIGGMVLAAGFTAIGFISWKFYKARTERNYHTL